MGHIRSLKPEYWSSTSLARCTRDARSTFQGLWTEADDAGRGRADPRILKAAIWPLDDDITPAVVESHLQELAAEHIRLYEVDEERYYEVIRWEKHQAATYRRGKPIYPAPICSNSLQPAANCSLNREQEQGEEQGTGNREQGHAAGAAPDSDFDVFWSAYPNKAAKPDAMRAFRNAKAPFEQLMAGLRAWSAYWAAEGTAARFIPYPQKFLNQRRWSDQPPALTAPRARAPNDAAGAALVEYRARRGLQTPELTNGGTRDT